MFGAQLNIFGLNSFLSCKLLVIKNTPNFRRIFCAE